MRLARQQVSTGEVGDRQRVAVPTITEEKFPFVVGTPERHSVVGSVARERCPRGVLAAVVADGAPGALGDRAYRSTVLMAGRCGPVNRCRELFATVLGAPSPDTRASSARSSLHGRRQPIRLPVRAVARSLKAWTPHPVGRRSCTGLPRNPELGAQRRHLLALEQAGDKPESLVHDVTLLPRHRPLLVGAKCHPSAREYAVTYRAGRTDSPIRRLRTSPRRADLHVEPAHARDRYPRRARRAAAFVPAWRAARVNPAETLRADA